MNDYGLYIHIPYCRQKCIYCDFYSGGSRIADYHRYVDAVTAELSERQGEITGPVRTLYIGGGTPSLMPAVEMERMLASIRILLGERWMVDELTIEINPDDVSMESVQAWLDMGVNRFSLGIQSLDNGLLKRIGRLHDSTRALEALEMLQERCENVSVDVMFGIPGQCMDTWRETLDEIVRRRPAHISCYSLMYEPGTSLTLLRDKGRISEAPEAESVEMYRHMRAFLEQEGYEPYEISNFARPGYRSRHNGSYWRGLPYLGLGPSAHSYDGHRKRTANPADVKGFLDRYAPQGADAYPADRHWERVEESLTDEELFEELVLTRMRTIEGIDIEEVRRSLGPNFERRLLDNARKVPAEGLLQQTSCHLSLTPDGVMVSDTVILDLTL